MVLCEARQQDMPRDGQAEREAAQGGPRTGQVMLFGKLVGAEQVKMDNYEENSEGERQRG